MAARALALSLTFLTACSNGAPPPPQEKPLDQARHTNRLAREKSPYLLQHAHNPVDWYAWGEDAFAKAKKDDKPIFLSIGYSTCHWCHVMERESFENEEIAKVLNEHFVSIKVDREERPDVDQVYMAAVQAMGEHGGWPLSVFLTPDRQPFFGGTYFPPEDRWGRPGFKTLLLRIAKVWKERREDIVKDGANLAGALAASGKQAPEPGELDAKVLERAAEQFEKSFDPTWGGFGGAPKFPRSVALEFMLRRHVRTGRAKDLEMVDFTLRKMAEGGIYDQLGGGYHRYSTDEEWLVPHFEKMLYDNALMVRAHAQTWQLTKNPLHERIARETIAYVMRDLRAPEGAFYSAEDADSEGIEGKFYVWNPKQMTEALGDEEGRRACDAFGVTDRGNWDPHEESIPKGNSCLRLTGAPVKPQWKQKLFDVRSKRVRPHRDDKILMEWNALMIGALAQAGAAFDDPSLVRAAEQAAEFLLTKMRRTDGRLLRRYRDGEAAIPAYLDDYASLADALVDLYQATFDARWIEEALRLAADMVRLFGDPQGGFYFTATDNEELVARMKEIYDGALPSGNAVALHALVRLSILCSRDDLRKVAETSFRAFAAQVAKYPSGYPHMLAAFDMLQGPLREIVIAGDGGELLRAVRRHYLPNAVLARADERAGRSIPMLEGKKPLNGRAAVYVCENYACQRPVSTVEDLEPLLTPRR